MEERAAAWKNSLSNFKMPTRNIGRGLGVIAVGLGACALAYDSYYWVDSGHKAVMFSRWSGVNSEIYGEGFHLKAPWLHQPKIFLIRTQPFVVSSITGSKDLQNVNISLRVLHRPVVDALPVIYENLGYDYEQRVLPSIAQEVLKGVVARFNASQLITQRELVSSMIQERLKSRARDFNLLLDDVSITHLSFSREYAAAVEAKQVAQQEAERAKFVVEKAEQDRRSIVIKAEGDAESALMISRAIRDNPKFLELRRIEAARDIAHIISASNNKLYLDANQLLLSMKGDFN